MASMNRPINIAPRESWSHERIRMEGESRFLGWGVLFALIAVGFAHWGAGDGRSPFGVGLPAYGLSREFHRVFAEWHP
jgi:hypothetical protein